MRDAGALIQRKVVEKRVDESKKAAQQMNDLNASVTATSQSMFLYFVVAPNDGMRFTEL